MERLARCARETTSALVAHLAEFDARRLYRGAGYRSLFAYCTEHLRVSEYGAYNRMEAARAARRFPVILEMLSDGSLNLATVRLLAPHLTSENHHELLESAFGRSKREVEELVARHAPRPAVPTLVRRLPNRGIAPVAAASGPDEGVEHGRAAGEAAATSSPTLFPSPARPAITPLAPERYQIRFTASAETYRKLRQAQELLGHALPSGDVAAVFDRALSALLTDLARKKLAATEHPRTQRPPRATSAPTAGSRHMPAHVRRTVWERDGGQCAFVAKSGSRCSARKPLEFHHVHPYGAGGEATVGNIEMRCRTHNGYEAEVFYRIDANGRGEGIVRELAPLCGRHDGNSPRGELGKGVPMP